MKQCIPPGFVPVVAMLACKLTLYTMRRWYKLLQFHVASGLSLSGAECRSITTVTRGLGDIRRGPAILMDSRLLGLDKCFRFIKWNWSLMTEKTRRNMIRIVEPTVR